MRRLPFHNIMLWVTILTLLWSSQGQGYVWCVVADGPTHLESALESHCDRELPSAAAAAHVASLASGTMDACGPCLDLAATGDTLQQRKPSADEFANAFLLAPMQHPASPSPIFVRHLVNNLVPAAPPRVATTLLAHRTVVLLI